MDQADFGKKGNMGYKSTLNGICDLMSEESFSEQEKMFFELIGSN